MYSQLVLLVATVSFNAKPQAPAWRRRDEPVHRRTGACGLALNEEDARTART